MRSWQTFVFKMTPALKSQKRFCALYALSQCQVFVRGIMFRPTIGPVVVGYIVKVSIK